MATYTLTHPDYEPMVTYTLTHCTDYEHMATYTLTHYSDEWVNDLYRTYIEMSEMNGSTTFIEPI